MKWLSPDTESLILRGCSSEMEYPIQCQLRYRTVAFEWIYDIGVVSVSDQAARRST